jgi:putative addiction module killer protein
LISGLTRIFHKLTRPRLSIDSPALFSQSAVWITTALLQKKHWETNILRDHHANLWNIRVKSIKDKRTRFRIEARLNQVSNGYFGDHKLIDAQIGELRFFFGGGLRIYYTIRAEEIILLLNGGDKTSQKNDIEQSITLFNQLEES